MDQNKSSRGVDYIGVNCAFFCHDGSGNILLHKRSKNCRDEQGAWDVGAGAMEFGETFEDTVRREVKEEYGVDPLEIQYIGTKNILREHNGRPTHWIKNVHWVLVDRSKVRIGEPEKMDEIGWFPIDKPPAPLHSQYQDEVDMVKRYFDGLKRPKVGVGVMIMKGDRVLLGKRKTSGGSHGNGEYAWPGGHMEYMESFEECAKREVREEAGIEIVNVRFLRLLNLKTYAPKHYVDIGLVADWKSGEPEIMEPEKCEGWDWYDMDNLPQPLFGTIGTYIEAYKTGKNYWDF